MTYHAKELVSPTEVNIIKVLSDGSALLLLETLWGEAIAMMKVVLTALGCLLSGRSSIDVRPWSVRGLGKSAQCAAWPAGNRATGRVGNGLLSGAGHRGSLSLAEKVERIKKASSRSLATGTVLYFCYSTEVRRCRWWQLGLGAVQASSPFIYVFIIVGRGLLIKNRGSAFWYQSIYNIRQLQ